MISIDIPLPRNCGECRFCDYTTREYPYCRVLKQDRGYPFDVNKKKFPNCPLVPVIEEKEEKSEIARLKRSVYHLQNRCMALTEGSMCIFCGMRSDCEPMKDRLKKALEKEAKGE